MEELIFGGNQNITLVLRLGLHSGKSGHHFRIVV